MGRRERVRRKQRPLWRELAILTVIALALSFLIRTFVAQVYVIPSQSMVPTLLIGDRIVTQKLSYDVRSPEQGEVVVFASPGGSWDANWQSSRSSNLLVRGFQNTMSFFGLVPPDENDLVKRVIATGGQRVECCDAQGRVLVNGKPIDEPYVRRDYVFVPGVRDCTTARKSARCFPAHTIAAGRLWVMGDNRCESADSRYHPDIFSGEIPESKVRGKVAFRMWPPGRFGSLDTGRANSGPVPCQPAE